MAFTSRNNSLTKENILKHIDSYQLFKTYCEKFKEIGVAFKSEFRKEQNPSCFIIIWKGDLLYKDFGENSYRVFDYIAKKFDTNYTGALIIVNRDFKLGLGHNELKESSGASLVIPEKSSVDFTKVKKNPTIIEIKPRPWTQFDKKYWSDYHIPLCLLDYHNIKSISHYCITNDKLDRAYYAVNPFMLGYSMDYYWSNNIFRRKLYFPQLKRGRFISNVNDTIVQGWTLLPKSGDILFITKSYKDILIFNLLGYWAIAPNNEGSYIPDKVMEKLKHRFKRIIVWFDNDEGGIIGATRFSEKFNLIKHHNPLNEPKDPSDYVKEYNLFEFDKLVTDFLNNAYR